MNKSEIEKHLHLKKKISHYPQLPACLFREKPDKGLIVSCLMGFKKRLSNWLRDDNNAKLAFVHEPRPKKEQVAVEAFEEL
jgi:hypothetical protein